MFSVPRDWRRTSGQSVRAVLLSTLLPYTSERSIGALRLWPRCVTPRTSGWSGAQGFSRLSTPRRSRRTSPATVPRSSAAGRGASGPGPKSLSDVSVASSVSAAPPAIWGRFFVHAAQVAGRSRVEPDGRNRPDAAKRPAGFGASSRRGRVLLRFAPGGQPRGVFPLPRLDLRDGVKKGHLGHFESGSDASGVADSPLPGLAHRTYTSALGLRTRDVRRDLFLFPDSSSCTVTSSSHPARPFGSSALVMIEMRPKSAITCTVLSKELSFELR